MPEEFYIDDVDREDYFVDESFIVDVNGTDVLLIFGDYAAEVADYVADYGC